jgi:hypothetical protein
VDDLGLTADDRDSLRVAYSFGTIEPFRTIEPREGSTEEKAFRARPPTAARAGAR